MISIGLITDSLYISAKLFLKVGVKGGLRQVLLMNYIVGYVNIQRA